jgi:hypothetical protein
MEAENASTTSDTGIQLKGSPAKPQYVEFDRIGTSALGYLSIAEKERLPFPIKRVYWTYFTPESVTRGGHAHKQLKQILVAVAGRIVVNTETLDGQEDRFELTSPDRGLLLPCICWRTMQYSHSAVQMVLCSMEYSEDDYIRNYADFRLLCSPSKRATKIIAEE